MYEKRVKIQWKDAVVFSAEKKVISLSVMETTGTVAIEHEEYVLVRDPITVALATGKRHPEKQPTFYYIPRGTIVSIENTATTH